MITSAVMLAMSSLVLIAVAATDVQAADVKCLCPLAMQTLVTELGPEFERASGHKLTTDFATLGANADRVAKGELADVVILLPRQTDDLEKQGKLAAGSRVELARVGYGVIVRKDAPRPDINSVEALKRTLLSAKSISYGDPAGGGPAGIYVASLLERLGIAPDVKTKTKLVQNAELVVPAVVGGDADMGFTLASTARASAAVEFIPLPAEVQNYTVYVGAVIASSKQADAARVLLNFLSSPAVREAMKAKGFEPR